MSSNRALVFLFVLFLILSFQLNSAAQSSIPVGGFSFSKATTYSSGGYLPIDMVLADVNGDGVPDVLVLNGCATNKSCTGSVAVLLGNHDGTFGAITLYETQGSVSTGLAVMDVNGDGNPDVLTANSCLAGDCTVNGTVSVLLGNGDGTFQPAILAESGVMNPAALAVSDVNGDGKLDAVLLGSCAMDCPPGNPSSSTASVLFGNGDGTFLPPVNYPAAGMIPSRIVVADVNNDSSPDLVITNCAFEKSCAVGGVSVLLNNGDGTFQAVVSYASGGAGAGPLAVDDVDDDGKPDVIVVNTCTSNFQDCTNSPVSLLMNEGNGVLRPAVNYQLGGNTGGAVIATDLDGDHYPDLVVGLSCQTGQACASGSTSSIVSLLLANDSGAFRTPVQFDSGGYAPRALAATDVNGDGKLDLLVLNQCDGSTPNCDYGAVGVLLNTSTPAGPATTTTQLSSLPNPAAYGESITLSAAVQSQVAGMPTGTVGFGADGNFLSYATLDGHGVATWTVSTLAVGTHAITASYYGDSAFGPSSGELQLAVEGGAASLSPSTLNFGTQPHSTSSSPLTLTLTNTGNVRVNIASIRIEPSGSNFSQSNNCGASLAANASCTIRATFTPTAYGASSATLVVQDDAIDDSQSALLQGTTELALSSTSITFAGQYLGASSTPQSVTVTNTGTTTVALGNVVINSAEFTISSDCGGTLVSGASCKVSVRFNPASTGERSGTLTVASGSGGQQTIALEGTGLDFSVAASGSSSVTVSDGQAANFSLVLSPVAGFSGTVKFTCTGAPSGSTCAVAPDPIVLDGPTASSAVVTVTTVANTAALYNSPRFHLAAWLSFSGLPGLLLLQRSPSARMRFLRYMVLFGLLVALALGMACGGSAKAPGGSNGSGGGGTPSGSYPISVTAKFSDGSTTLTHTTTLTLVVH